MFVGGSGGMLTGMELPVTFEYTVGVEDVLAGVQVDEAVSADMRRQWRRTGLKIGTMGLLSLAGGIVGSWLSATGRLQVPSTMCTSGIVLGLIMLWFARPLVFMRARDPDKPPTAHPETKRAMEKGPMFRTAVGPQILTIAVDAISEERKHSMLSVDWEEMDRVVRGRFHLFFHRPGGSYFILPHSAMKSVDAAELADEVERLIASRKPKL